MNDVLNFFSQNFATCVWLAVMIAAMIPTLESKIAIPFAMNTAIWGTNALPAWQAFLFAFLGSMIPCIVTIYFIRKIKNHTTGFVTDFIKLKYSVKTNLIEKQHTDLKKYIMMAGFVALPLPLTGVWAGSFIAGFSNLNLGKSILSISIGALISCGIVTLLCTYLENSITYVLMISLMLVITILSIDILAHIIRNCMHKKRGA